MRIGELADRSGVPTKTIRYYEEIGLVPPPERTEVGYRDYEPDAAGRLAFIRAAQSVGLTLGEIREVLAFRDRGEAPCAHVASLIERHAADLSQRIAVLERMRRDLERLARKARTLSQGRLQESEFCHIIETGARRAPYDSRPLLTPSRRPAAD
ncbi:MAG: heavy metal-responsive transcriptional regulator [Actinomycetota bacterium]